MRTIIDLPAVQLEALDVLCRREGISRAEAVRRAVAAQVRDIGVDDAKRAFGLWRDRPADGLAYQERARAEWSPARAVRPKRRKAR